MKWSRKEEKTTMDNQVQKMSDDQIENKIAEIAELVEAESEAEVETESETVSVEAADASEADDADETDEISDVTESFEEDAEAEISDEQSDELDDDLSDEFGAEQEIQQVLDEAGQLKVLEALLFASPNPLTPQSILERMPANADLGVLLPQLQANYNDRGIQLVEINGAFAFRTAQSVAAALTIEKDVERKLSRAALETMAVIAYHQPITRAEIENIRGVATNKGTIDMLLESGWIKPGKRRETPGRPLTWLTTNAFLDHFQLGSIMELPGLEDLKAAGLLDRRPAIDTVPNTGDLFDDADVSAAEVLSGVKDETSTGEVEVDEFAGYEEEEE
jgi:segregation and condensation protein B